MLLRASLRCATAAKCPRNKCPTEQVTTEQSTRGPASAAHLLSIHNSALRAGGFPPYKTKSQIQIDQRSVVKEWSKQPLAHQSELAQHLSLLTAALSTEIITSETCDPSSPLQVLVTHRIYPTLCSNRQNNNQGKFLDTDWPEGVQGDSHFLMVLAVAVSPAHIHAQMFLSGLPSHPLLSIPLKKFPALPCYTSSQAPSNRFRRPSPPEMLKLNMPAAFLSLC